MTTTLRALLVDDERLARRSLRELLEESHPGVAVVGEADSVESAAALAQEQRPDVIFLDIQMPPDNGFALLPHLAGLEPAPAIVFVTAHSAHAVQAFEVDALDYLLKPVSPDRLAVMVKRIESHRPAAPEEPLLTETQRISELQLDGADVLALSDPVALRDGAVVRRVTAGQILAVQAEGSYTRVLLDKDHAVMMKLPLSHWEKRLPCDHFSKTSRSLLLQHKRIAHWIALSRDRTEVFLHGRTEPLILSRLEIQRLKGGLE